MTEQEAARLAERLRSSDYHCEACRERVAQDVYDRTFVCLNCREALKRLPTPRRQIDLQRAHDVLLEALNEFSATLIPPEMVTPLLYVTDCLCWALGHDHGVHVESHIGGVFETLEKALADIAHREMTVEKPMESEPWMQ